MGRRRGLRMAVELGLGADLDDVVERSDFLRVRLRCEVRSEIFGPAVEAWGPRCGELEGVCRGVSDGVLMGVC